MNPVLPPVEGQGVRAGDRLGGGGEVPLLPQLLQSARDGADVMGGGEGPGDGRALPIGEAGDLGQVHPHLGDAAVETVVHGPQVLQHLEPQAAAVVGVLTFRPQGVGRPQLSGVALGHYAVPAHRHQHAVRQVGGGGFRPVDPHRGAPHGKGVDSGAVIGAVLHLRQQQLPRLRPVHDAAGHLPHLRSGQIVGRRRGLRRG